MAKKDAYYFSHDANARNDVKILKLRRINGMEGLGIYWCLVEILRETEGYAVSIKNIDDVAFNLSVDPEKVKDIIFNFDLFVIDGDIFSSARLSRSMHEYEEKINKKKQSGKMGVQASVKHRLSIAQAPLNQNVSDAQAIKGKESKEKEIESKELKCDFSKLELGSGEMELARLSIKGEKGFMPEDKPIHDAFKLFRGMHAEDAYQSKSEFYKHFYNWVKKQTFTPSTKMEAWRAI